MLPLLVLFVLLADIASATTGRYRLTLRDDPSTTIVVAWDQISGSNGVVHYGTTDFGTAYASYPLSQAVSRSTTTKGMNNQFARITGLLPDTVYYFVIHDSQGTSARYSFRTLPNDPTERLSIIAGGDSRNNQTPRVAANTLVAKLRPHAVMFGGDMTNGDTDAEWEEWMDDWQNTIAPDGRMTQIIATRGNHEQSNSSIIDLFDIPGTDAYYALTLGGSLVRTYTLNTEISISGNQTTWLQNDLTSPSSQAVTWKMAQYHKPMRPHTSGKVEGNDQYNNWANLFHNNGVKVIVECDAHTVKTTWPVVPTTGSGNDMGFVRDDANGSVYVGEGCWGAPLRTNNDDKSWTRASGMFNQFKWIFIDQGSIEIRTIKVDNASSVGSVTDASRFLAPANLDIWNPSSGSVVTLTNAIPNTYPVASITSPTNGTNFPTPQQITITANASDADGTVQKVDFFQNNIFIGSDATAPYSINWTIPATGNYTLYAVATDDLGATGNSNAVNITSGTNFSFSKRINNGNDDVEEGENGTVYTNSTDIELVYDSYNSQNNQTVGLRFNGVTIPQGATITNAYIQFTADETSTGTASLNIHGHDADNSVAFSTSNGDVSSRTNTTANVAWSPPTWSSTGQSGAGQQTPDIKAIIAEIVSRAGWTSGNALSIIITGTGTRTAEAYEGSAAQAAELFIEYSTVQPNVPPTMNISSPANNSSYPAPATISIDVNATDSDGNIDKVEFYQDGNLIGTDFSAPYSFSMNFNNVGNYSVKAIAYDDDGDTDEETITIVTTGLPNVIPTASFTPATATGNAPFTVYFDASASVDVDGSIVSYAWDFDDGSTGTGTLPWHTYYVAGVYTVTLVVTDDMGATANATATITVNIPNSAPTASFTTSSNGGQAPKAISFNASGALDGDGTIDLYSWDFGDGNTSSGPGGTHKIVSHTYTSSGVFSAVLTVTDNFGATGTYSKTITISPANLAPTAVLGASTTSGQAPLAIAFSSAGSVDSDGSIISYAWDFGDGATSTASNTNHTYTSGGNFTAVLTVTDNQGATGMAFTSITVAAPNMAPTAAFVASATSGYAPLPVNFDATSSADADGSIVSYAWDFGDGNSGSGQTTTHTYLSSGNYSATLTVTDDQGLTATLTESISVQTAPVGIPLEVGSLASVTGTWQTVTLTNTYTNMVVIANPVYASNSVDPVVTRINNASGNSFQIKVQRPNNSSSVGNYAVQYMVVEEGTYTIASHGIKMEANLFVSDETSYRKKFRTENRSYANAYTNPIVLGQVMSVNDADWSVFWSSDDRDRKAVANAGYRGYNASKHVAEDSDRSRNDETIGVIVIEAGDGSVNGMDYTAGNTGDYIQGPDNSSSGYSVGLPLNATNAILSAAGMDGSEGHWPVFAGANGPTGTSLTMWADEDQLRDNSRSHNSEQIAYLAFGTFIATKNSNTNQGSLVTTNHDQNAIQAKLYPNPVVDQFVVSFNKEIGTKAKLQLIDVYGKILMEQNIRIEGNITETIELANLPTGQYFVVIQNDLTTQRLPIVIFR